MLFSTPIPFREALQRQQVKVLLPTVLGSDDLAAVGPALLERGMFSARVVNAEILQTVSDALEKILQGQPDRSQRTEDGGRRADGGGQELVAMDRGAARLEIKRVLEKVSYRPPAGDAGTIKDLRTDTRLNLILDTNTRMAEGYGAWAQGQDDAVLDEWPAQELVRIEDRQEKRNWYERWRAAGGTIYPGNPRGYPLVSGAAMEGRCIALKNDPIWERISRFGQPYPPFDFNSGVDVRDVTRAEAMELGLIDRDTRVARQERPFNGDLQATPEVRAAGLREALLGEGYTFDGDVLLPKAEG